MARKLLEAVCGGGADTEIAEFKLAPRPGHFKRARHRFRTLVFGDQRQQRLA